MAPHQTDIELFATNIRAQRRQAAFECLRFDLNKTKSQVSSVGYRLKAYVRDKSFYGLIPLARQAHHRMKNARREINMARLRFATVSKKEFINDLRAASENNIGYASGKIGRSQQHWMYYEILLHKETDRENIKKFEDDLSFHGLKQVGIFPAIPEFYLEYNKFYLEHIRNLDSIGICYHPFEPEIINYYKLENKFIYYENQEPDRSTPSNDKNCYLQYFENKRILLICPFAEILKQRATKEIFENVWSKTGKKWFYPKTVEALEFPYGFAKATQNKYSTSLNLYKYIIAEIKKMDFDVALIAAAGLAIPLASYVKSLGKIGIDLGGHLQVLFGVIGKRWRDWEDWKRDYFNEHWIDMPDNYRPQETDVCDLGAYW